MVVSDVYEKIKYEGERSEYVLKNGKARNCYGLLIDVHNLQAVIAKQEERIRELERFAKGCVFTMGKAKKHNKLSDHDNEMIRQRIERGSEMLAKGGE